MRGTDLDEYPGRAHPVPLTVTSGLTCLHSAVQDGHVTVEAGAGLQVANSVINGAVTLAGAHVRGAHLDSCRLAIHGNGREVQVDGPGICTGFGRRELTRFMSGLVDAVHTRNLGDEVRNQ